MKPALLITILALAAGAACSFHWSDPAKYKKTVTLSIPSRADASLGIETQNGGIDVGVGPGGDITLEVTIRATTEERLAAISVQAAYDEGGVLRNTESWPAPGRLDSEGASYKISVPTPMPVTVKSSNGALSVSDMAGALVLESSNGAVKVSRHKGTVRADTSNGAIEAEGALSQITAHTSNGSVEVRGADGLVDVETSNGSVDLQLGNAFRGQLGANTSNGRVDLKLGAGFEVISREKTSALVRCGEGPASSVSTSNGSVTIRSAQQ